MSARQVGIIMNISHKHGARVLADLVEKGFISIVEESNWINGKARYYKLNWMPYHGKEATDEWRKYKTSKLNTTCHSRHGTSKKRVAYVTDRNKGKKSVTKNQALSTELPQSTQTL